MVWHTEGIRVVAPVKWRRFDGLVGVFWEAESQAGAKGYYLADDPRIMVFFSDVSSRIRMSNRDGELAQHSRPMTRAVYVPAGVPMWTTSKSTHRFSHLNLHLHRDRLMRFLSPSATPNPRLIEVADAILGRQGRMIAAIRAIGRGADAFEGAPFALEI